MDDARATPTLQRIEALDFVRGCALFGILLMNITGMGLPQAYSDPTIYGGSSGADLWSWIITEIGFEGTQRALFSILFGAGIVLFSTRLEAAGHQSVSAIFLRRNLWLIAFGLVNSWLLLWSGDILYAYGIIGLVVFAFRGLGARVLLAIAIGALIANAAWNASDTFDVLAKNRAFLEAQHATAKGATPSPAQRAAIRDWNAIVDDSKPQPKELAKEIAAMRGGWWTALGPVGEDNLIIQSWWVYREFGDVFGMMILGLALFKLGVLTLERRARTYAVMMVAGYAIGIPVNILETQWIMGHGFSVVAFSEASITYDLGRLAMTMGHLGLLLLLCKFDLAPRFRRAMTAVGRMALTNYLTHSLIALILFIGLGWFGQLARHQLYVIVFAIWGVQIVISPLWLRHFRFGPVEWAWRSLTYGAPAPLRGRAGSA